jgi:hypothetical protein
MNHVPPAARKHLVASVLLLGIGAAGLVFPSCLLIGTTEHVVKIGEDGIGEALLRLSDIRSDGTTDSAVVHDTEVMIASFDKEGVADFEKPGRKIRDKVMYVRGDTLFAEISYSFQGLDALEGLRISPQEIFVVVSPEREIVRTNGRVRPGEANTRIIAWKRDATQISYVIRERQIPPSTLLGPYYTRVRTGRHD